MKIKSKNISIAIISSSFWPKITHHLEKNCMKALQKKGVPSRHVDLFQVPGALEIPLIAKKLAKLKKYDAIIAFGAVVKGKTYHFEQVADECIRGCADVSLQYEIPVIYQVLAVYNRKDAMERATRKMGNRGVEGAHAALEMIQLLSKI